MADNPFDTPDQPQTPQAPKKNAGSDYQWNANNVFNSWDLNPLAQQIGAGADGVRDTLSTSRDAFLQPLYQQYRSQVGVGDGKAAADDQTLFNDQNFQNFAKTGQLPQQAHAAQPAMQSWLGQTTPLNSGPAPTDPRRDALYNTLLQRSQQSLAIDPNTDPNLSTQVNAFRAEQTRAARNLMNDRAEASSPYANNRAYDRVAQEQAGQATGAFSASLINNELQARRDEIANALQSMQGMLTTDQQAALQKQLADLDAAVSQRGQDIQYSLGNQSANNDLLRTMLQNQQFNSNLNSQNDQFAATYGLNSTDRANYWDAVRRGLLS
jgi:hypothetical protein